MFGLRSVRGTSNPRSIEGARSPLTSSGISPGELIIRRQQLRRSVASFGPRHRSSPPTRNRPSAPGGAPHPAQPRCW
jgi:hypothetical protein